MIIIHVGWVLQLQSWKRWYQRWYLPASDYCRALFCCLNCAQRFDYRALDSSRNNLSRNFSKGTNLASYRLRSTIQKIHTLILRHGILGWPCPQPVHMGYWPNVRSRWLDIGQVLFCVFMDRDAKKNEADIQPSYWTNLVNKGFIIWLRRNFSCGI